MRNPRGFLAAVRQLQQLEAERNVIGLIHELENPLERGVLSIAGMAARALARNGDDRVLKHLLPLLRHSSPNVRMDTVRALGELGDKDAVLALISALHDSSTTVRDLSIRALGQLEAREAVEPLRAIASSNEDGWTRLYAAETLATLGDDRLRSIVQTNLEREKRWALHGRSRTKRWLQLLDR